MSKIGIEINNYILCITSINNQNFSYSIDLKNDGSENIAIEADVELSEKQLFKKISHYFTLSNNPK